MRWAIALFVVLAVVGMVRACAGIGAEVGEGIGEALFPQGLSDRLVLFAALQKAEPALEAPPGGEGYFPDLVADGTQYHCYVEEQDTTVIAWTWSAKEKVVRVPAAAYDGRPRRDVAPDALRPIGIHALLVVEADPEGDVTVEAEGWLPEPVPRRLPGAVRFVLLPGTYTVRTDAGRSGEITLAARERVRCAFTPDGLAHVTR